MIWSTVLFIYTNILISKFLYANIIISIYEIFHSLPKAMINVVPRSVSLSSEEATSMRYSFFGVWIQNLKYLAFHLVIWNCLPSGIQLLIKDEKWPRFGTYSLMLVFPIDASSCMNSSQLKVPSLLCNRLKLQNSIFGEIVENVQNKSTSKNERNFQI